MSTPARAARLTSEEVKGILARAEQARADAGAMQEHARAQQREARGMKENLERRGAARAARPTRS
jgi:hypothetical protein